MFLKFQKNKKIKNNIFFSVFSQIFFIILIFPEPVVFHIVLFLVILNLLKLSRKWNTMIKKWLRVEEILPQYEKAAERTVLSRRINSIAIVFFMSALGLYDFFLFKIKSLFLYISLFPLKLNFNNIIYLLCFL